MMNKKHKIKYKKHHFQSFGSVEIITKDFGPISKAIDDFIKKQQKKRNVYAGIISVISFNPNNYEVQKKVDVDNTRIFGEEYLVSTLAMGLVDLYEKGEMLRKTKKIKN